MNIYVDKRIELVTVVQTLCGYWEELSARFAGGPLFRCAYKDSVTEYFVKHRNHGTVKLYEELCNDVADISAFLELALCRSDPPELEPVAEYEDNFGKMNSSVFPYGDFTEGLRRFYADTDFGYFYESSRDEYRKMIGDYESGLEAPRCAAVIENYLGIKTSGYSVVIAPLVLGNFGIAVKTSGGEIFNYSVISPWDCKDNGYLFGSADMKKEFLWHETSHPVINGLTGKYTGLPGARGKDAPEKFKKIAYPDIETVINEYIIRAITIRLFELDGGGGFAEQLIKQNIHRGFENIEAVKNYLRENSEDDGKFMKDRGYGELVKFVMEKI